jgi:hypothetical protein
MANPFQILVGNLNSLGFFDFLLPWIFTFAVLWGLLLKSKVLGDNQRVNGVVSLVVAFFIIGFGGPALGAFFTTIFGLAVVVIAGLLVALLFLGMGGWDFSKVADPKIMGAIFVAIAIIIFFMAAGSIGIGMSGSALQIIFVIIILAIAIGFITK